MRDVPSPGPTHGDHMGWGAGPHASVSPSTMDMPRPGSSRRWSPPAMSARFTERLPSLSDYSQPPSAATYAPRHWEAPPSPNPLPPGYAKGDSYHHQSPMRGHEPFVSPRIHQGHELPPPPPLHEPPGVAVSSPRGSIGARPATSALTSARSTSKHPAPSPQDTAAPEPKRKKRRQAFSCAECAKRKQKCNRETPCQHCVSRKVPHLCVPSARSGSPPPRPKPKTEVEGNTATSRSKVPEQAATPIALNGRVHKLERIVNAVLNRVDGLENSNALAEWRQTHQPAVSPPAVHAKLELPVSASPATSGALGRMESEGADDVWLGGLDRGTVSRNPLPQTETRTPLGLDYHGSVREQLENIVDEGRTVTLQKALRDLPPKDSADRLVAFFFTKVNPIRYPIDEHLFRQAYEAVYASGADITPASVLALPLIFAVLAIATKLSPEGTSENNTVEQRRKASMKLLWGAQFGIMVSTSLNAENLQLVETRILIGLYLVLMHERRLAEGWLQFRAATATATALCLHRDGSLLDVDPYMTEYRRRLWSYLCHADATYSCLLGRPVSINPNFYDTKEPSNVELSSLLNSDTMPRSKPLDEPTFATFLILRNRLAGIVSQIVNQFQKLHNPIKYCDVQAIDQQLRKLHDDLPPQFQMLTPDKSLDKALPFLAVHRYYIQTEILHFTIILHRPWFLRQVRSLKYALSRRACFEAAITDFKIRQAFHKENPDFFETLLGGSFREFNCAMIAGINLLLEPTSPYASDMWKIMTNFMEHNPYSPNSDEFSRREAAIIHTLSKRASSLRRSQSGESGGEDLFHPLQDNTSFERGGRPSSHTRGNSRATGESSRPSSSRASRAGSAVSVQDTPAAASQGLETPPSDVAANPDQIQDLFNKFLTANSEFGRDAGKPKELRPSLVWNQSLLGVLGLTMPVVDVLTDAVEKKGMADAVPEAELHDQQFAGDSSLAFSAIPSSLYLLRDVVSPSEEVNSPQYWDTFANSTPPFVLR
ncbi:hypothetical protein CspHIS471_0210520 [Cutaneotrichosporon sp. HIS471]|nr:hypothetical protein CspHIS471_0210520 [Cutaneotrichosporon sp. HIS471]